MKIRRLIEHHLGIGYVFLCPPENDFGFIADNLHKIPVISKAMCLAGRHDFEFVKHLDNLGRDGRARYELECFYCERRKHTSG